MTGRRAQHVAPLRLNPYLPQSTLLLGGTRWRVALQCSRGQRRIDRAAGAQLTAKQLYTLGDKLAVGHRRRGERPLQDGERRAAERSAEPTDGDVGAVGTTVEADTQAAQPPGQPLVEALQLLYVALDVGDEDARPTGGWKAAQPCCSEAEGRDVGGRRHTRCHDALKRGGGHVSQEVQRQMHPQWSHPGGVQPRRLQPLLLVREGGA